VASDAVQKAKELLRSRLSEIDQERAQLEHALASLGPASAPASRSGSKPARRPRAKRRSGGKRARRGQREAEFLAQIKSSPGAKISDIAGTIGVAPQQLYPIARRLSESGKVTRKGEGFHLTSK
jgi:hypothetical protein